MVKEFSIKIQPPQNVWYLDLYISWHLTNDKDLFIDDFCPKCLDFTTIGGQILQTENIDTIAISLTNRLSLKLCNVVYISDCDSNFILLGQLCESKIIYVDNSDIMTLT